MPRFADQINILSKMTPRRFLNSSAVLASYYYSRLIQKPVQWGLPISLSIEPTTACNLGCPECPSGLKKFSRPTGNLKPEQFDKFLNEVASRSLYLTFYFQGEPYINPNFLDMVAKASSKNIYTSTSTNAHFLNDKTARKTVESGLDRLIISIDGTTQEVYEQYRVNGSLDKVLEGTKNILKWKKELKSSTPHVIFQFLVVKPNEHQIDEVRVLADELGVDELRLKTAQVYEYKHGNELIPSMDKYSRYARQSNGEWRVKNKLVNRCWRMWQSCVITWDGLVVPCCFDKDATHRMGDLKTDNFKNVWFGKGYKGFRQSLFKGRQNIDICKNCSEGTKVWA
jgi:radical SAM protein with 4Fe4S-binding SPASM domain